MNWKVYGRKRYLPNLRHYTGNLLDVLRKTMKRGSLRDELYPLFAHLAS
jgi:hypothetical protein